MATSLFIRKGAVKNTVNLSCRVFYTDRKSRKAIVNLTVATKQPVNRLAWEKGHDGNANHYENWSKTDEGKRVSEIEDKIRSAVDDYVLTVKGTDKERIKRIVGNVITPTREDMPATLVGYCERYIEESRTGARLAENGHNKGRMKTAGTLRQYGIFLNLLKRYERDRNTTIALGDVNTAFVTDFRSWLAVDRKLMTNSISSYSRVLKVFLRAAEKKGLVSLQGIDVPSIATVAPDTVYLSQDKVSRLYSGDFGKLNTTRDLFVLGCETGQRYSDYKRICSADIVTLKDGTDCFKITQKKTGKTLFLPVTARARAILERNGGKLKGCCLAKFNSEIKECCRLAGFTELVEVTTAYGLERKRQQVPFYELVSSHTARRTCATLMYLAGCPLADIMAITGHAQESTLRKYLRMTDEEKGMAVAHSDYFKKRLAI